MRSIFLEAALAVLRDFREEDKEDRILSINYNIHEMLVINAYPHIDFFKKEDLEKWQADITFAREDNVFIKMHDAHVLLITFLDDALNKYPRDTPGHVAYKVPIEKASAVSS